MDGSTPLHKASAMGYKDIVQFLVRNGSSLDIYDSCGTTPLQRAGFAFHRSIEALLLSYGAISPDDFYRLQSLFLDNE